MDAVMWEHRTFGSEIFGRGKVYCSNSIIIFIIVGCILLRYVHVYLSNIYQRSQLRIYWSYFSLSSQHVSAPSGHLQVKYISNVIYIIYI
jgi:hypothetical protein